MKFLPAMPSARVKVLIGDDDCLIAQTLSLILNHSGFEARDEHSGAGTIATAVRWRPDLLLLDLNMQDMHGLDVALAVKAELPECRVLFLSGAPMPAERACQAAAAGYSFECIAKPIHPSVLIAMLRDEGSTPASETRKRPDGTYDCEAVVRNIA